MLHFFFCILLGSVVKQPRNSSSAWWRWLAFEQDLCKQIKRAACQAISFLTIEQVANVYGKFTVKKIKSFRHRWQLKLMRTCGVSYGGSPFNYTERVSNACNLNSNESAQSIDMPQPCVGSDPCPGSAGICPMAARTFYPLKFQTFTGETFDGIVSKIACKSACFAKKLALIKCMPSVVSKMKSFAAGPAY